MFQLLHPKEPQLSLSLLCYRVYAVFSMSAVHKFLTRLYLITRLSDCPVHQLFFKSLSNPASMTAFIAQVIPATASRITWIYINLRYTQQNISWRFRFCLVPKFWGPSWSYSLHAEHCKIVFYLYFNSKSNTFIFL